jgi:hypothetical protein
MLGDRIVAVLAHAGMCCIAAVIAGCGGGGDSGGAGKGSFGATFTPTTLEVTAIEGNVARVEFAAALTYSGAGSVFLVAEADAGVWLAVDGTAYDNLLNGVLSLRGDLAPGAGGTELRLHACVDQACSAEVQGSPVVLPIRYTVKPNLQVQSQVQFRRSGREPAPVVVLPVSVPGDAGSIQLTSSGPEGVFDVSFDGSALRIATRQVRTGDYNVNVTLQGSADARYARTVVVRYIVDAPAGGEKELALESVDLNLFMPQGTTRTQVLKITRPTWTDTWEPPQVVAGAELLRLRDLGGDRYELTADTAGLALGNYSGALRFDAGATGGVLVASVSVYVAASFYPTGAFTRTLSASTSLADLKISSPVVTVDGLPARWSAVSQQPWLRVLRASGQTGVDMLELEVDPALGGTTNWGAGAIFELSIDRPGTLALPVQVSVWNLLPDLQRGPAVFVGDRGRIYIEGALQMNSELIAAGALKVDGATLRSAAFVPDTRFVGDVSVLAVDFDGAVPGRPITVRAMAPLAVSQVSVGVEAPVRVPPAYLPLPYGAYRAPQYAPGLDALYFSGQGSVYRWAHAGAGWSLAQVEIVGLADVALRPDEGRLYAVGGTTVRTLDPVSLAQLAIGELHPVEVDRGTVFDLAAPPTMRGLAFAADGRAMVSLARITGGQRTSRGAYWITSAANGTRGLPDLTVSAGQGDPGSGYASGERLEIGVGLVASAGGHSIVSNDPSGYAQVYRPERRAWAPGPNFPVGVSIVAVSDSADRMVRSDGIVLGAGNPIGSLTSVVPFTHVVGGFGMTQDGRYGLVYGYRIATEGGAERARDPTLWVVDMQAVPQTPMASAPVVATLALGDAAGCTTTLVPGETCRHMASVTLAPGGGSAFVLGPRGLAAVPLPASVDVMPATAERARAAAARGRPAKQPMRTLGSLRAR